MKKNKKEEELFEAPQENMELETSPEVNEEAAPEVNEEVENQETSAGEENQEMEMELDGEEVQGEMEELVSEKVKKEEKENKEQKSKRGPKPGGKKEEKDEVDGEEKPAEKKEKALNFNDQNIVQREIKKGRLSAPQGRIEKSDNGYVMKLADGIIFPQDSKTSLKDVGNTPKMNDGKYILTELAANSFNTERFKAQHENGEEVEHDYVRVELHKPGREKDVVELFTVREAKNFLKIQDAKATKKEEEAKKKAEKEKAEKEKAEKENKEAAV